MGTIHHHVIVVTCCAEEKIEIGYWKAVGIFGDGRVSTIMKSPWNGYYSFFIGPDGSKEGWPESSEGDSQREEFIEWLDGKENNEWCSGVEVSYGELDTTCREIG